jgi:uridine kinase
MHDGAFRLELPGEAVAVFRQRLLDYLIQTSCRKICRDPRIESRLLRFSQSKSSTRSSGFSAPIACSISRTVARLIAHPRILLEVAIDLSKDMANEPHHPTILGIAGCSGSGKTTLARELANQLEATLFPLDLYYRDLSQFPLDSRHKQNFDHPDSLESELFIAHIQTLKQGLPIDRPIYDFRTHSRVLNAFDRIHPARFVVVEGIMALHWPQLCSTYDFSVYVDAPDDLCLTRRIHRDKRERGRTERSVREQYAAAVKPMADLYVLPSQARATMSVSGTDALDWSIEQVLRRLRTTGLLG